MDDTSARLERIFADVFWADPGPAGGRARGNTPSWDSVAHLNLVLSIEQEFGISLADAEVVEMSSFAASLATVRAKLQRRSDGPATEG